MKTTRQLIGAEYVWSGMNAWIDAFVGACLHCLRADSTSVLRPFGPTLHSTKPGEILHFDYVYIGQDEDELHKYLLVIKDNFSGYLRLVPTKSTTAEEAASAIEN